MTPRNTPDPVDSFLQQAFQLAAEYRAETEASSDRVSQTKWPEAVPSSPRSLQSTLDAFFQAQKIEPKHTRDGRSTYFVYRGHAGKWVVAFTVKEPSRRLAIYSLYPQKVPVEQRANVAELMSRLNYQLLIGNFEMDFEDGELRYRTSLEAQSQELNQSRLRELMLANVKVMDYYWTGIQQVIAGDQTPQQVVTAHQV